MFGFGKKEDKAKDENANEITNAEWSHIASAMGSTFGTRDHVEEALHVYMPNITNAIYNSSGNTKIIGENQIKIHDSLAAKIDELKELYEDEKRKNQELQEKYNALVERMAAYIERDGRGR